MVVVVDEVWQGIGSFGVGGEYLSVCPFGGERPVEPLGFAVLPRAVRFDELVADAAVGEEFAQSSSVSVAEGVVGDQSFNALDAAAGEVVEGAFEERCACVGAFVGVDLAVGDTGVIVDDAVHVVVANHCVPTPVGRSQLPAVGAPAASVGDAADLLDVHVDQLTWTFAFVADGGLLRGSDRVAGERVQRAQARQVVTAQDATDRACWHAELGTKPILAATVLKPGGNDPGLEIG